MNDLLQLQKSWPLPTEKRPIDIVAAGRIVQDAHLPAYRKAGLTVQGIYDVLPERAKELTQ